MSGRQVIGATIFCRDCGYALDGLRTHECPECGRAFDPADPSSFYIKNMPGPNARWWLKQPGWLFFASIALPIGLALWLYRIPYYYYEVGYWSFLSLLWLWAWLIYAPVLLIRCGIAAFYGAWVEMARRWRRDVLYFLLVIIATVMIEFCLPMRAALLIALPKLNSIVENLPSGQDAGSEESFRAGLYRFSGYSVDSDWFYSSCKDDETCEKLRSVTFFIIDLDKSNDGSVFVYFPDGVGDGDFVVNGPGEVGHLYGNWYCHAWD